MIPVMTCSKSIPILSLYADLDYIYFRNPVEVSLIQFLDVSFPSCKKIISISFEDGLTNCYTLEKYTFN